MLRRPSDLLSRPLQIWVSRAFVMLLTVLCRLAVLARLTQCFILSVLTVDRSFRVSRLLHTRRILLPIQSLVGPKMTLLMLSFSPLVRPSTVLKRWLLDSVTPLKMDRLARRRKTLQRLFVTPLLLRTQRIAVWLLVLTARADVPLWVNPFLLFTLRLELPFPLKPCFTLVSLRLDYLAVMVVRCF